MHSRVKSIARIASPDWLYRRYRRLKVASLIADFQPREVTHRYGGHELRVHLADPLAQGWYDHDWDESAVFELLREQRVLVPNATVFDFGAHQAVVALILSRIVGQRGRVIAVEAEPHNARVAQLNRELNDATNLTVIHAAGAATEGVTSFTEGLNGRVDERAGAAHVEVPAVTVDGLAAENGQPDLVFIDVEGYEGRVLEGAPVTLANGSTSFMVEVHEELQQYGGSAREVLQQFEGFKRYVSADEYQPFEEFQGALPMGRFFLVALPAARRADSSAPPASTST